MMIFTTSSLWTSKIDSMIVSYYIDSVDELGMSFRVHRTVTFSVFEIQQENSAFYRIYHHIYLSDIQHYNR